MVFEAGRGPYPDTKNIFHLHSGFTMKIVEKQENVQAHADFLKLLL